MKNVLLGIQLLRIALNGAGVGVAGLGGAGSFDPQTLLQIAGGLAATSLALRAVEPQIKALIAGLPAPDADVIG